MKTRRHFIGRLASVVKMGAAIFAASALQAQSSAQSAVPLPTSTETSGQISHRAKAFLREAAQANEIGIALANVAQENSQNTAVKALAQTMRIDHQQNVAQLQSLAQDHEVTLGDFLSWGNQRTVNHLQKSGDPGFDKEYTMAAIKDRVARIKNFDKDAAQLAEPDLKQYAQGTLPTLRKHLRRCEEAARAVGVDEATISSIVKGLPTDQPEREITLTQN